MSRVSPNLTHRVRPLRVDDAADVSDLLDWAWFPQRSEAGWRWLCRTPRSRAARAAPIGYCIEDGDGRVAGVFGLFTQDYSSRDGPVIGATAHTLIVHPRIKGASRPLIDAVLDQPEMFGVTVLNANATAAPLYQRHGMKPWPDASSDLSLIWVTDPAALLAERALRARKARLDQDHRPTVERFLRSRVFETDLICPNPRIVQLGVGDLDARLDGFWTELAAEGRLTARRDAAAWRWRFEDPDRTRDPILLAWIDGGVVAGLVHAQVSKVTALDAPTLEILDLVALKAHADRAMPELVAVLLRNASRLGAAKVRLAVAAPEIEQRLSGLGGLLRRRGHPHNHVLFRPGGERLASDWRLTPFDGEHGICLRSPPRPVVRRAAA